MAKYTEEGLETVLVAMLDSGTIDESTAVNLQAWMKGAKNFTARLGEAVKLGHLNYKVANAISLSLSKLQ